MSGDIRPARARLLYFGLALCLLSGTWWSFRSFAQTNLRPRGAPSSAGTPPPSTPPNIPPSGTQLEAMLDKRPDSLRLRMETANSYAREGKADKVVQLLNPYTDQLDNNGFLLLASSYSELKDYANEVRVLAILAKRDDGNYQWHMLLGQAYLKQAGVREKLEHGGGVIASGPGRSSEILTSGIKELRQVLEINAKKKVLYKPAFDLLLNTLLVQKNNSEARELIIEGIRKFGDRPELYHELCRLDSTDGFLVQAVDNCRRSIELSPNYPDHYVYLAQSQNDQGDAQASERTLINASKHFPNSEFVQWATGTLFFRHKNFPVAGRYYQTALKADPGRSRSQFGLAQSLYESGSEVAALEHFVAACKADATTMETFLTAGSRLKHKGQTELGEKYVRAANTCRPYRKN